MRGRGRGKPSGPLTPVIATGACRGFFLRRPEIPKCAIPEFPSAVPDAVEMAGRTNLGPSFICRLPPGDRDPALRVAADRVLTSLCTIEAEPRLPGRDAAMARARRISVRQAKLLRLAALAKSLRIALQLAAIERAASHRKAKPMTHEPKSIALGNAILAAMRTAIEGGMSPQEAIDTGLTAVCSISVQVEGEYRTGAKLIIAGEGMVDGSPEGTAKRTKRPN